MPELLVPLFSPRLVHLVVMPEYNLHLRKCVLRIFEKAKNCPFGLCFIVRVFVTCVTGLFDVTDFDRAKVRLFH